MRGKKAPKRNELSPNSSDIDSNSRLGSLSCKRFSSPLQDTVYTQSLRIFVATWNVGGKLPHKELNLNDFIPADDHSDLYVLGFQEIVPLNAGNVLVLKDSEPAVKWLVLIDQALNGPTMAADTLSLYTGSSFQVQGRRLKTCNCPSEAVRTNYRDSCFRWLQACVSDAYFSHEEESRFSVADDHRRYRIIVREQMVGIFLTVWVRSELEQHIGHLRFSHVGRGIMGRLGNKGCISVSMTLHQTTFCFVCSHLAAGDKEGDELRRNSDVAEILKNTNFRRICGRDCRIIPRNILENHQVIWLGDLNYRIALSYSKTRKLLEDNNWEALLEKDQLKTEREAGRVFDGWKEGNVNFAPTYKYSNNSDTYAGETVTSKKKRRTPAWCDRILWHGDGMVQLSYTRGELKFSDHRPVCAVFRVEVGMLDSSLSKPLSTPNMKVGVEELLPPSNNYFSYGRADM